MRLPALVLAGLLAVAPAAHALPEGPEEIMVQGKIDVLVTFPYTEWGTGRTGLMTYLEGGVGLYRGQPRTGPTACTDLECSPNPCRPFSASMTHRFEGEEFVIEVDCLFAGQVIRHVEWRWQPLSSTVAYDCAWEGDRGTLEQAYMGTGARPARLLTNGYLEDECVLFVANGVGRYTADWH